MYDGLYPDTPICKSEPLSNLIKETEGYFDVSLYVDVLEGRVALYRAKKVIVAEECESIASSYRAIPDKYRYNVYPPIEAIGEPLYFSFARERYFKHAALHSNKLAEVFANAATINYPLFIYQVIRDQLADRNYQVRVMQHLGVDAFFGIMRSWGIPAANDNNERVARLHEDRVQLRFHQGLETQHCIHNPLVSTCIYFNNGCAGGELSLYNYRPSLKDAEQEELSTHYGYGFADSWKENKDRIHLRPEQGDIVCFWSDFLHEVDASSSSQRINSTFFSALVGSKQEVIFWS